MSEYKFIHLLWKDDIKFAPGVIRCINQTPAFDGNDHLFVVTSSRILNDCPFENVVLDTEFGVGKGCARLINKYAARTDHLIVHSICDPIELLSVKRTNLKKIVWRSWGHDAFFPYQCRRTSPLTNLVKIVLERIWKRRIRSFQAICGADFIDEVELKSVFGDDIRYYSYIYTDLSNPIKNEPEELAADGIRASKDTVNVLVGHSGYLNDNHIEILSKLENYKAYDIHLFLILVYGNKEYIAQVKQFALAHWKEKMTIVEDFIPKKDYREFLKTIDIAILDGKQSYALGHVVKLVRGRKKLIINRDGIIRKAFDLDHIPYLTTDSAFSLPFEEFSSPACYTELSGKKLLRRPEDRIDTMRHTFLSIESIDIGSRGRKHSDKA